MVFYQRVRDYDNSSGLVQTILYNIRSYLYSCANPLLCHLTDGIAGTQVAPTIWSFIEPGSALICACLPVLVPPLCAQIVALTSSIYSSYNRSRYNPGGSVPTIGQQRTRARRNQKSFTQIAGRNDSSIPTTLASDVEVASPIESKNDSVTGMYEKGDLEKGMNCQARSFN